MVTFDTAPTVVVQNARMDGRGKAAVSEKVTKISASGKTNVVPGVTSAVEILEKGGKSCKTIVILSDGRFALRRSEFLDVAKRFRKDRIGVAGLVLGRNGDRVRMKSFSKAGRGALATAVTPSGAESMLRKVLEEAGTIERAA